MVERTKADVFDEFEGVVKSVELEASNVNGKDKEQYHVTIEPTSVEVGGKTGLMHEWINKSDKATDTSVPEGSVLERYLGELEVLNKELKSVATVPECLKWMEGKKFKFVKKTLGKSYDGHEAKGYWTPVQIL